MSKFFFAVCVTNLFFLLIQISHSFYKKSVVCILSLVIFHDEISKVLNLLSSAALFFLNYFEESTNVDRPIMFFQVSLLLCYPSRV